MKALAVVVNIFLPGIGTFIVGKWVQGLLQILLGLVAALLSFTGIGILIGAPLAFAVWIWAIVSAVNAPSKPIQVQVQVQAAGAQPMPTTAPFPQTVLQTGAGTGTMRLPARSPFETVNNPSPAGAAARTRPMLRVLNGPYADMEIPLEARKITIGRNPNTCNLVLPDDSAMLSGTHATVAATRAGDGFVLTLRDEGSSNGTFLESGARVPPQQETELQSGERFYLASREFMYQIYLKQ